MVMRKMREKTKIIMLVTALAFVALMVFQWGMDLTGRSGGGLSGELGRVNGTPVTYDRYMATYRNLYDQVQQSQEEPISSVQNEEIEDAAWDEVVNQILIQQELGRRGIRVSNDEILQAARFSPPEGFRNNPAFQTDGQFDLQKYQDFLASPAVDEVLLLQLEAYYRDVIPRGKLLRQVSSGVFLSDAELWRSWQDFNERAQVRFVPLNPARVPDEEVEISDSEVERYYVEHQEDYEVSARATVKVVVIPKTTSAADTAASLERALAIRQEILDGAEFAEVARRESTDEASAQAGGDLGRFARGQMVPAFDEYVFSAPIGQVSEPIPTQFGFHLIEVLERSGDTAQARHILVAVERTDDSELALLTMADSLDELGQTRTLEEAAAELGMSVDTLDINRDFAFAPSAGQISEGADWAFEEASPGDVSPVFESSQAFYALELVSSEPERVLSLEEARTSIEQTLRQEKKLARVAAEGRELASQARSGERSLEDLAVDHGLEIRTTEPFTRGEFVPGLGRQNAAIGAAFGLEDGQISDLVETETNAFVIQLIERIPADSAEWVAQKEDQRLRLASALQEQRLQQWLEGLRENARIVDRRDQVLRPADETDVPSLPPVF